MAVRTASGKPDAPVSRKRVADSPPPATPNKRAKSARTSIAITSRSKSTRGKATPNSKDEDKVNGSKPKSKLEILKAESAAAKKARVSLGPSRRVEHLGRMPLPQAFDHVRPPRTALVFGSGDGGEFGLGFAEDADEEQEEAMRGEKKKPQLHTWLEEAIQKGKFGQEGAGIEDLVSGGMHSLMIDESGRVWSWGVNDGGALGRPTDKVVNPEDPSKMLSRDVLESYPGIVQTLVDEDFRAVRIAAGDSVSVAISDTGKVKYWGSFRGKDGLMGFGGVAQKTQIDPVDLVLSCGSRTESTRIMAAACGNDHVLVLSTDGFVHAFGDAEKAQLGRKILQRRRLNGTNPERLGLKNIVGLGAGAFHSFAIDADGEVFGWGNNLFGQLGVADSDIQKFWETGVVERPTKVTALSPLNHNGARVVSIAAGENHSVFLFDDGSLWTCGKTVNYELGLAPDHPAMDEEAKTEQCIRSPQQIFFPPPSQPDDKKPALEPFEDTEAYRAASRRVAHVACGPRHNIAVTTDGFYYSWGSGPASQLGLGNKELAETPTLLICGELRTHRGLKATTGGQTSFIIAQAREQRWGE